MPRHPTMSHIYRQVAVWLARLAACVLDAHDWLLVRAEACDSYHGAHETRMCATVLRATTPGPDVRYQPPGGFYVGGWPEESDLSDGHAPWRMCEVTSPERPRPRTLSLGLAPDPTLSPVVPQDYTLSDLTPEDRTYEETRAHQHT